MRYPFSPLWLVILYSIAGYSAEEVSAIGGWSLKTVASNLKKLQVPPSESDSNAENPTDDGKQNGFHHCFTPSDI